MIQLPRLALKFFALTFGAYHALLGILSLGYYPFPELALVAVLLYCAALGISVFSFPGLKLKDYFAWISLAIGLYLPFMVTGALGGIAPAGYSTWHIGAVSTLMAIITIRQHPVMGWVGVGVLITQTLVWGGVEVLFNSGVSGAFLLVLAASATSGLMSSAASAARDFLEKSLVTSAQTAATSAVNQERQRRIQETLNEALPILDRVVERSGALTKEQRLEASLTESELRDQIRGRALQHPGLNEAVRASRLRGVEVQLLDDGGLDGIAEQDREELLNRAARELDSVTRGKVVIRAVVGDGWRLTIAALMKGQEKPDLFLRL